MESLSVDSELLYEPVYVDNSSHGIPQETEELENKTNHSDIKAIPELPLTAAPVLDSISRSTDTYKSIFASWKTPTVIDAIPDKNEKMFEPEVVVIEKEPLSRLETDRLAEPALMSLSYNDLFKRSASTEDKYDKLFEIDDIASKETRPQFPSFRSNTIAAVLGPAEPVQSDFVRLNLPPEEALSEAMLSFLNNQQSQSGKSNLDEQSKNDEQAHEKKEGNLGDLMEIEEEESTRDENDDPHYFDRNHDKELDDFMFSSTKKRQSSSSSAESSDHCVIDMENALDMEAEELRGSDRTDTTNEAENNFTNSNMLSAPSHFDEVTFEVSNKSSDEPVSHYLEDASIPEDVNKAIESKSNQEQPPLQYANLVNPVLKNNGLTFTIIRNEQPVVYEDLVPETEIEDFDTQNDHAAIHKTRNSPILSAVDTAQDTLETEEEREVFTDTEKFDKHTDDSVSEKSEIMSLNSQEEETANDEQIEVEKGSSQNLFNREEKPYDIIDSDEEEKESNRSDKVATVCSIYDSVSFEPKTDNIRNGSMGNEKVFEEDANSYDSVVVGEPEEENAPKFVVVDKPITEDWLTELISKPNEAKSDAEPMKPEIPDRKVLQSPQRRTSAVSEKKEVLVIEEPSVKVARMNLETKTPILDEESVEREMIRSVNQGYYNAHDFEKQPVHIEEKKRLSIKLEELSENDETVPPIPPPFVLNSPKRAQLDDDTKIYIQTMAREQRERHLLSIADGTVPPGSPIRIEDPMSGKIIEVMPKDFVQVIKEHPIQENEYDYLQGAASALDRYEMPAQRRSLATPTMSSFPPGAMRQPRHAYDEFDQRPNSQPWELPPKPAARTRFSLAAPTNYNHHMHAPPPMYLEPQQQSYEGEMQMTKQSGYPFNAMHSQTPTGYPQDPLKHLPPMSPYPLSPQEPTPGPYPLYNLQAQTLVQQQQSITPSVAPSVVSQAQQNMVTVNPAPIATPRPSGHKDYREDDVDDYNRSRGRRHSSDEESEHSQTPRQGRFKKRNGRPRKRPSVDPEVDERNRRQQDCMKRNCCCWIIVVTLMVLVLIFASVGLFVWLHFWNMEPSTTTYMTTSTQAGIRMPHS